MIMNQIFAKGFAKCDLLLKPNRKTVKYCLILNVWSFMALKAHPEVGVPALKGNWPGSGVL